MIGAEKKERKRRNDCRRSEGQGERKCTLSRENERAMRVAGVGRGWKGVACDIACCKLQFCCEIIIKYIMPSRLLPCSSPLLLYSPPF